MTVLVGALSLGKVNNAEQVKVQSFYIPKTFSSKTKVDDIMLLKVNNILAKNKLPKKIKKNKAQYIKIVCYVFQLEKKVQLKKNKVEKKNIPKSGKDIPAGTKCEVRGWGTTQVNERKASDTLQEVEVTVVDKALCNCYYNNNPKITEDMLCAGNKHGRKDTCWVG